MSVVRSFIENQLLEPLKRYPTVIQDTIIELMIEKLETLYEYTLRFPEIVSPNMGRLDILKAIADQFLFTVRNDADLQEQIDILNNILYVYSRRGSIDTIENMWKYYGGTLPKDVKVIIPSYNLFRYSLSKLSGTHRFANDPDQTKQGDFYRTGVYEVRLTNSNYPIPDLKRFMLDELVAAGNRIFFTNSLHMESLSGEYSTNPYQYNVLENTILYVQMIAPRRSSRGIFLSGVSPLDSMKQDSRWSGSMNVFFELIMMLDLMKCTFYYTPLHMEVLPMQSMTTMYNYRIMKNTVRHIEDILYCTSEYSVTDIYRYLYNSQDELIDSPYPGYFVLKKSLLGREII